MNAKLLFHSWKSCAESQLQSVCIHSDKERCLHILEKYRMLSHPFQKCLSATKTKTIFKSSSAFQSMLLFFSHTICKPLVMKYLLSVQIP